MTLLPRTFVDTYLPVHSDDPNHYITVARDSNKVSRHFKAKELYNPKTGMDAHPMSQTVIDCVEIVRSYFNIPIRIESVAQPIGRTYRNYPSSGANPSAHHLAQAIDFSFIADEEIEKELYLLMRDDFDKKGTLFQLLWNAGCRGFGSYDTFVHLDTVVPELYEAFRKKRRSTYMGKQYGRWNNMKRLKYLAPTHYDLLPSRQSTPPVDLPDGSNSPLEVPTRNEKIPVPPPKDVVEIAEEKVRETVGSTVGWIEEFLKRDNEDKYQDADEKNVGYVVLMGILLVFSVLLLIWVFKKVF